MDSPRIMGVGVGVFLLGFFLVICLLLCLFGSKTRKPGAMYTASTVIYLIVALVLLVSPKGEQHVPAAAQGYNATTVPIIVLAVLMSVGVLVALVGMLAFQVKAPVYARPLSYHTDILRLY